MATAAQVRNEVRREIKEALAVRPMTAGEVSQNIYAKYETTGLDPKTKRFTNEHTIAKHRHIVRMMTHHGQPGCKFSTGGIENIMNDMADKGQLRVQSVLHLICEGREVIEFTVNTFSIA